jgi:uncharacterized membrane protein YgcG
MSSATQTSIEIDFYASLTRACLEELCQDFFHSTLIVLSTLSRRSSAIPKLTSRMSMKSSWLAVPHVFRNGDGGLPAAMAARAVVCLFFYFLFFIFYYTNVYCRSIQHIEMANGSSRSNGSNSSSSRSNGGNSSSSSSRVPAA